MFNSSSIQEFVLIAPAAGLHAIEKLIKEHVTGLLGNLPLFTLVSDEAIAPDLRHTQLSLNMGMPGWVKQQLLKLAVSSLVQTPFYLVLDTDVLFAHSFAALDLFHMSVCQPTSPVCDNSSRMAFHAKTDVYDAATQSSNEQRWRANTAAFLQLELPRDWKSATGSTPQLFATEIARQLGPWLQQRFGVTRWQHILLDGVAEVSTEGTLRRRSLPWTELNLYWLYSHHVSAWELYHTSGHVVQDSSVWSEANFEAWHPCSSTADRRQGLLAKVPSHLGLDASMVLRRLEPCIKNGGHLDQGDTALTAISAASIR